ncbi:MAG: hydroxyphenylacetyl-CoA thioesterase PaaI [Proteobacteria bacterium]|nr:MAG: hydroxyphenylacetyl-CoA thioesterase PaaI [Pseudomonadota bacterium]
MKPISDMTENELAQAAGEAMFREDLCSRGLGIEVLSVSPGEATIRMAVREDMVNGHGTCHGGMIFTLADSCFAFACNSRNQSTVAFSCTIDFVRPANLGDVLTAVGREISLLGRNGIYDIAVTNQDGEEVAQFRGRSRAIPGTVTGGID